MADNGSSRWNGNYGKDEAARRASYGAVPADDGDNTGRQNHPLKGGMQEVLDRSENMMKDPGRFGEDAKAKRRQQKDYETGGMPMHRKREWDI